MNKNLNDDLYTRFGLNIEIEQVRSGFLKYTFSLLKEHLDPLLNPEHYADEDNFKKSSAKIIKIASRQMFLDYESFKSAFYNEVRFNFFLDKIFEGNFHQILINLQILINILNKEEFYEFLKEPIEEIKKYLDDYPILGIMIKVYKKKAPQIFPAGSKVLKKQIDETLEKLEEDKKYENILEHFEEGLKEFLTAKTKFQLKDVVEDMYTVCDEVVSVASNSKAGFRNIFIGKNPINVGLNKWQLKIFEELKDWMDKIKHGVVKTYSREDVEMIISLISSFVQITLKD